jgi:hypothetical protein
MFDLRRSFKKVKIDKGLVPIWCWNSKISEREISAQIDEMAKKNITTFVIRPQKGLIPVTGTDEYWDKLRFALNCALQKKIKVLIYEDMCYAYNQALADFTQEKEERRLPYLVLHKIIPILETKKLHIPMDPEVKYVIACRIKDNQIDVSSMKNLSSLIKKNTLSWKVPQANWRLYVFASAYNKKVVGGYQINFLNAQIVKEYLNSSLLPYRENLRKWFGRCFQGFVLETPNFSPDPAIRGIPWTKKLISQVSREARVDAHRIIAAIFLGTDKKTSIIRHKYLNTLINFVGPYFLKPVFDFKARNRFFMDVFLNDRDLFSGAGNLKSDFSSLFEKFSLAGVLNFQSFSDESMISTELASNTNAFYRNNNMATILGRNRSGVSFSLKALKFEADKKAASGATRFYIDGCYFHLKQDLGNKAPANSFAYSYSWQKYNVLSDYLSRLSYLLQNSTNRYSCGVLLPYQSAYTVYDPINPDPYESRISNFNEIINRIKEYNIKYTFLNEHVLQKAKFNKKKEMVIKIGSRELGRFRILILPEISTISIKTRHILERFISKGGRLIFIGVTPYETLEKGKDFNLLKNIDAVGKRKPNRLRKIELHDDFIPLVICYNENISNRVVLDRPDFLKNEVKYCDFSQKGVRFVMMLNSSETQSIQSNVRIPGKRNLYLVNLTTGELHSFSKAKKAGEYFEFTHQFGPTESYMFAVSSTRLPNVKSSLVDIVMNRSKNYRVIFKNEWKFTAENLNVLPLTNWSYKINYNRDVNPGINCSFESFIEVEYVPTKSILLLKDLLNQPINHDSGGFHPIEISVNGYKLKEISTFLRGEEEFTGNDRIEEFNFLGRSMFKADISQIIKKGYNRVVIKTVGSLFDPISFTNPILFLGDFSLKKGNRGWVISMPVNSMNYGSWANFGYPFYYGYGLYEQVFEKPGNFSKLVLKLGRVEEVAWISVNDRPVEVLPWAPGEANITPYIVNEKNNITIRVANSHNNLMKMMNYPSGLVNEVYLDVY